jgi:mono/diheme cytochrome c family protein
VSRLRVPPPAAGLVAAALAFGAVALASDRDAPRPAEGQAKRAAEDSAERTRPPAAPAGGAPAGRAVFARMGCGSCHHLTAARSSGGFGPDLDRKLPNHTRASLRAKILAPGTGSMMPPDFGARMSDAQLDALVTFLLAPRQ